MDACLTPGLTRPIAGRHNSHAGQRPRVRIQRIIVGYDPT